MQKRLFSYFGVIIFIMSLSVLQAQCLINKGKDAFTNEQYYKAIGYFEKQIQKKNSDELVKGEASYYLGRCNMLISKPNQAVNNFKNSLSYNYFTPDLHLYYGKALQMLEKFDDAAIQLKKYANLNPNDTIAEQAIESLELCLFFMENPNKYKLHPIPSLNSAEMDYCPFFKGSAFKTVYFTSSRSTENHPNLSKESGEYFSDIYMSELDKNGLWEKPVSISGNVNTEYDEGAASLNRNSRNLYFTRCSYNRRKDKACRIYFAKKTSHTWTKIEELIIPDIPKNISIGHPCISHNELCLYFVADSMLGGYGGKDIYKVTREKRNENFGSPQNLGPDINTRYDDAYPYIRFDNTLYFASRGHNSIGGYDIFKAKQQGPASYIIENLGYPINSPHEDFGIVFMDNKDEGFITSERKGGIGKADIYYFVVPKIQIMLEGIVWDKYSNSPIGNAQVSLMDSNNVLISVSETNDNGKYLFELKPEKEYTIYVKSDKYKVGKTMVSTINLNKNKVFIREIFLEK